MNRGKKKYFTNFAAATTIIAWFLIAAGFFGYIFYDQVAQLPVSLELMTEFEHASSCRQPIGYNLGSIDSGFGISREDLLKDIKQAADIWSDAADKDFFVYSPDGTLIINFIYDYRQSAIDELQELETKVSSTQASYDSLKAEYDDLYRQYNKSDADLRELKKSYQQKVDAYNLQVEYWNDKEEVPQSRLEALDKEGASLDAMAAAIAEKTSRINDLIGRINTNATALNKLVNQLNLDVSNYNIIGNQLPQSFEQGVYTIDRSGQRIDIYEFEDKDQMMRLLVHEFGHALGMDHSNNPDDMMYYLNRGKDLQLSANDLAQLRAVCEQ